MTPEIAPSLVADVGGTNTRVALADAGVLRGGSIRRFANREFSSLQDVLQLYLQQTETTACLGACVAIAGPVRDDLAQMTNLGWSLTTAELSAATGAPRAALLNDLQAQGHALDHITPKHLRLVRAGLPAAPNAARLVVGLGTGFNAAPVHCLNGNLLVAPSECGHMLLPLRGGDDMRLASWLEARHGFAALEEILSGRGLERLFLWHAAESNDPRMLSAAEIMAALAANDPLALRTAQNFVKFIGRVTGTLAMVHLPFGGVFMIGGVARAFTPYLDRFGFEEAFCDMGRFSNFLKAFPVHLVEDDYAALSGCAAHLHAILS
jgi:glucokinase